MMKKVTAENKRAPCFVAVIIYPEFKGNEGMNGPCSFFFSFFCDE